MDTEDISTPHLDVIMQREGICPLHVLHKTLLNLMQHRIILECVLTDDLYIRVMQRFNGIRDRVGRCDMTKSGFHVCYENSFLFVRCHMDIDLFLELRQFLLCQEEYPVRSVLEQRCAQPIDNTRSVGFLALEHLLQRTFH